MRPLHDKLLEHGDFVLKNMILDFAGNLDRHVDTCNCKCENELLISF